MRRQGKKPLLVQLEDSQEGFGRHLRVVAKSAPVGTPMRGHPSLRSLAPPLPTARGAAGAPFGLAKRETGRARSKRKGRLDALRCSGPPRDDRCKRRFWPAFGHAIIFCDFWDCRPVADGAEVVGVVIALSLLLFSLPLAVPRGNWCNGRMWTSARKHKPLRPPG
mgnify:CR=1 FL=1